MSNIRNLYPIQPLKSQRHCYVINECWIRLTNLVQIFPRELRVTGVNHCSSLPPISSDCFKTKLFYATARREVGAALGASRGVVVVGPLIVSLWPDRTSLENRG